MLVLVTSLTNHPCHTGNIQHFTDWHVLGSTYSWRHLERSCARFHVELRPQFCCWRSTSVVPTSKPGSSWLISPVEDGWWAHECSSDCSGRLKQCGRINAAVSSLWELGWWLAGPASDFVVCDVCCIWNAHDIMNAPLVKNMDRRLEIWTCHTPRICAIEEYRSIYTW